MTVTVADLGVDLLPERAAWWPAARTLFVADLHWGKSEVFHAHGIPVPAGMLEDDLDRLARALARTRAERLLVLGDLVHGPLAPSVVARVATWREQVVVPTILVRGNHDRHAPVLPDTWRITCVEGVFREGGFAFTHAPEEVPEAYAWAGHLHPMAWVRGRGDALRLPCFHLGARVGVLPAFGAFTGGVPVRPAPKDRVYGIVEGAVIRVPGR